MYACLVISFGYFAKNAFDSSKSSRDAVLPLPMVRSFQSKRRISLLPAPVLTIVKLVPMPLFLTKVRRREKARRAPDGRVLEETADSCHLTDFADWLFSTEKKRTAENNHQHGSKMPFLHFSPFPRHAWRRRAANADAERGGTAMYQPG